jgi:2-oxoglutarate ferredoxin oxidoreductase subunit alpha
MAGQELPAVIVNIEGGPGLGHAFSQGDYFQSTRAADMVIIGPSCAGLGSGNGGHDYEAFDLADKYRNPVIILGRRILGQIMEPVVVRSPKNS